MVELFNVDNEKDISELKSIIQKHKNYTKSTVAEKILLDWEKYLSQFIKVFPTDYRIALGKKALN